jgi:hypothetical protein
VPTLKIKGKKIGNRGELGDTMHPSGGARSTFGRSVGDTYVHSEHRVLPTHKQTLTGNETDHRDTEGRHTGHEPQVSRNRS